MLWCFIIKFTVYFVLFLQPTRIITAFSLLWRQMSTVGRAVLIGLTVWHARIWVHQLRKKGAKLPTPSSTSFFSFFSPKCLFLLTGTKYLHIRYICWNTNWGYVIAELFMSHYVEVFSTLWNINYPFAHWRCVLVCFQSKEERLLELETENAILHLRLAEVRWFLTFIT